MIRNTVPRAALSVEATVAVAVGLAILATLVVSGALSPVDQYAVDHWMPYLDPSGGSKSLNLVHQLYPHVGSPLQTFCNVWTFPASIFVSAAAIGVCCVVLARRGHRTAAVAWLGAWFVANAVEVAGKSVLHRPALHVLDAGSRVSFNSFVHSFPSGHALRAVLTAAVIVTVWRSAAWPALAWVAVVAIALVVNAAHTPSDVLGGVLLGLLVVLVTRAVLHARVEAA